VGELKTIPLFKKIFGTLTKLKTTKFITQV